MEYTDMVQWHTTTVLILWVPGWRTGGLMVLQMNCVGEASHAYIIKHPIQHIDSLWWNTLTSVQWHYYMYDSVSAEQHNWRTDGLQMNCVGESISCLHNQAPNWTQLTPCDGIHWHQYSDITSVLILWLQAANWRRWSPNELLGESQSHAYIIKHPIETQLTSCDGIHWHQYSDTLLRVLILWVPEQHNWRTDGLQMNCLREHYGCIHHKDQLCFNWCLLCKSMRSSPSTIHLETIRPPVWAALALTESIHVVMSLYWCQCIPSQEVNCVSIVLDYVSMRLLSPTQFIWRHLSSSCAALALTE